ncbi:MAG: DUF302 domain-containing protein [Bacteroidota bacterium]|nr:DUF302 domain-containing protein [Bacteroidota bacterium]MDP4233607.1 DUF302 domain-containing protein [Bacteroidota bacterium]MDP4243133.1 DUF302 domain-containing protein [Bacteroidota bacterium]MDP4288535.1 DUF302 domain-containing protein [Bacteroidota bacterium]
MDYYFSKTLHTTFDDAIARATAGLATEGFGVLTEIDVAATLKKKLDVDFRPYRILGACNPAFAHRALSAEDKIGTMLPCNVVVQELAPGQVEVIAVDPIASMAAVQNEALMPIATEVREKLKRVIDRLS